MSSPTASRLPAVPFPAPPIDGTITERKQLRRNARWLLGTGREDPPTLRALVHAVDDLHRLLFLTSGGRWALAIVPGHRLEDGGYGDAARQSRSEAFDLGAEQ